MQHFRKISYQPKDFYLGMKNNSIKTKFSIFFILNIFSIKMFIEVVPDYAVDIPLIWQYIGEIIGAFIGAPSSNMILLKPILQLIPDDKSKQLFQDIIRYAVEFSVRIMFNLIFFNLFRFILVANKCTKFLEITRFFIK